MILNTKNMDKCYGCFACSNICPKNCIELKQNAEGFFMPEVDMDKCIDCGLCDRVCLIEKEQQSYLPNHDSPQCFYGHCSSDDERKKSASGGLSNSISKKIINNNGVVFGVVGKWFEDVHHIKADTNEGLIAICGSKNIQSRVGKSYVQAKKELQSGKQVLFTGTPCQIAALYSFLGKEYENLFTADLVCHGVPSQKVLKAYISQIEQKNGKKVVKFGRDETFQYVPVQYIAWFDDGTYEILMPENSFYRKAFLSNLMQRKSCTDCAFSKLPRIADITMGDVMFNVDTPKEQLDPNNLGVSLFTVNSKKGQQLLNMIQDDFKYYPMQTELAIKNNRWVSHGIEENKLRSQFFDKFLNEGFAACEDIILKSYNDMRKGYIREGKMYRLKLLFKPVTLAKKIAQKIRKRIK